MNFYKLKTMMENAPRSVLKGTGSFQDPILAYTSRDDVEHSGYRPNDVFMYVAKVWSALRESAMSYMGLFNKLYDWHYANNVYGGNTGGGWFLDRVGDIYEHIRQIQSSVRAMNLFRSTENPSARYRETLEEAGMRFRILMAECESAASFDLDSLERPEDYGGPGDPNDWYEADPEDWQEAPDDWQPGPHPEWPAVLSELKSLQARIQQMFEYLERVDVEDFLAKAGS